MRRIPDIFVVAINYVVMIAFLIILFALAFGGCEPRKHTTIGLPPGAACTYFHDGLATCVSSGTPYICVSDGDVTQCAKATSVRVPVVDDGPPPAITPSMPPDVGPY